MPTSSSRLPGPVWPSVVTSRRQSRRRPSRPRLPGPEPRPTSERFYPSFDPSLRVPLWHGESLCAALVALRVTSAGPPPRLEVEVLADRRDSQCRRPLAERGPRQRVFDVEDRLPSVQEGLFSP